MVKFVEKGGIMKAVWRNRVIAKSDNVIEVEGTFYFPLDSIRDEYFLQSNTKSTCPWKGKAHYLHIKVNGEINEDAAWYYVDNGECNEFLKNRIAFWKGVQVEQAEKTVKSLSGLKTLFPSLF